MSAFRFTDWQQRVETTNRRAAGYGHRTFNGGFAAMNPKSCRSLPDPKPPSRFPRSRHSGKVGFGEFRCQEAAVRDLTHPAKSCRSRCDPHSRRSPAEGMMCASLVCSSRELKENHANAVSCLDICIRSRFPIGAAGYVGCCSEHRSDSEISLFATHWTQDCHD